METASPVPAVDLVVSVTVATTGDFGYGLLPASVTIPARGSATVAVSVTTTDDSTDGHRLQGASGLRCQGALGCEIWH